jgi:hypothetical protein
MSHQLVEYLKNSSGRYFQVYFTSDHFIIFERHLDDTFTYTACAISSHQFRAEIPLEFTVYDLADWLYRKYATHIAVIQSSPLTWNDIIAELAANDIEIDDSNNMVNNVSMSIDDSFISSNSESNNIDEKIIHLYSNLTKKDAYKIKVELNSESTVQSPFYL